MYSPSCRGSTLDISRRAVWPLTSSDLISLPNLTNLTNTLGVKKNDNYNSICSKYVSIYYLVFDSVTRTLPSFFHLTSVSGVMFNLHSNTTVSFSQHSTSTKPRLILGNLSTVLNQNEQVDLNIFDGYPPQGHSRKCFLRDVVGPIFHFFLAVSWEKRNGLRINNEMFINVLFASTVAVQMCRYEETYHSLLFFDSIIIYS